MITVEDAEDLLALYIPAGTRFLGPADASGAITRDVLAETGLAPTVWNDLAGLHLIRPGAASSIMARWRSSLDDFSGWYVNLQEPMRPTSMGFDTMDQTLDLIVDPDLSWAWKDSDELEASVTNGFFTLDEAAAIRREADHILTEAQRGDYPFVPAVADWRPDSDWPAPVLRSDWADAAELEDTR